MRSDVDPCALREKLFRPFPRRDPSAFLGALSDHDRTCRLCISLRAEEAEFERVAQAAELRRLFDLRADRRRNRAGKGKRVASALRTYVTMCAAGGAA